ncbi:uncharacterized protein LOC111018144 [Momordica charantia]|uniref:Uncharacterized protein LOC111018144 n=1 Tax=Momordica charantia TaxID=3673 RepID=A0A6J1D8Z5_MOMCH|nr:uncharacterized protein LOC111018144 [Momordica charantia]
MAPYEALYGRKCRSSVHWDEVGERVLLGPELVQETNGAIQKIRARMQTTQSRQKSYADVRRRALEFDVGDHVFLCVAPVKGVLRFGKKGKLSPRFIGPFEILERIGPVAYRLALPPSLSAVHNVFHVSMLRKYVHDPSHVLDYEPLQVDETLCYKEVPIGIVARETKVLRNRVIDLVKVLWRNHQIEEATWEREDEIRAHYPELFEQRTFEDENFIILDCEADLEVLIILGRSFLAIRDTVFNVRKGEIMMKVNDQQVTSMSLMRYVSWMKLKTALQ